MIVMRKIRNHIVVIFLAILFAQNVNAEEIRDFYSEPGLNPFKDPVGDLNESIDTFSGTLQLSHGDITVPGNGGMDITVTRFYTNHQDFNGFPPYNSIYGIGWNMHFGRIVVPQAHVSKVCNQAGWAVSTIDNPSVEHPDGARELLVLDADGSGDLITKSNWRVKCSGQGFLVSSPDGTQRFMDQIAVVSTGENSIETSWYTSEITDVVGNKIRISYLQSPAGYVYADEVTGWNSDGQGGVISDGRLVKFNYAGVDTGDECFRLLSITSNGQTWNYNYESLLNFDPGYTFCGFNLTRVDMPEGLSWQYQYYPRDHPNPGKYSLSKVTYPYNGMVNYAYQHVQFDPESARLTTSIQTKTIAGLDITPGTWTYTFEPGSRTLPASEGGTLDADVTTIFAPNGTTMYTHQGAIAIGFQNQWATGLLLAEETFTLGGQLIEQTVPSWDKRLVSFENYYQGKLGDLDTETYAAIQTQRQVWRNGGTHSTLMSNFDEYGNPRTIEETSIIIGAPNKVTNITYYNDPLKWIIGKTEDEMIIGVGTIDRAINSLGQVTSEDKYGVVTGFTYTAQGDVNTTTDARDNDVTKTDYFRGIPRLETHPESVTIARTVNPTGTVESLTNGRGFTKHFTYDSLNRLKSIDFPINADVIVNWTATGKELTRANYKEVVTFDGFGKEAQIDRTDLNTAEIRIVPKFVAGHQFYIRCTWPLNTTGSSRRCVPKL
jgi:hypothetical protein